MRWLLTSWGSRGDLHPFLALGRGLRARGDQVTLVGHPEWAGDTEQAGLRFVPTGEPPRDDFVLGHPEVMSTAWGGLPGLRALIDYGMVPSFEPTLAALLGEIGHHDAIVAHHFVFAARVAAELAGKPLVTVSLAPGVTPSAYTRPAPNFGRAGTGILARTINRFLWSGGRLVTELRVDPAVNQFRKRHGLKSIRGAVFDGPKPDLHLQLYSEHFAPHPPDWPSNRTPSGFCFYDPPPLGRLSPKAEEFLAHGDAPTLFTLGSAAVQLPGDFYRAAVEVLEARSLRGVLLIGPEANRPAHLPKNILALNYAPYGLIMPRARAVVHQCGIGTLSHALRAGLPSVACPFAFDQPNNSRRLEALGLAEVVLPRRRNAREIGKALDRLLASHAPARAKEFGARIRGEDGIGNACDLLSGLKG